MVNYHAMYYEFIVKLFGMPITAVSYRSGEVETNLVRSGGEIPSDAVLLNVFAPTPEESNFLNASFDITVPTKKEMGMIEVASPLYKEGDCYYMMITAIYKTAKSNYLESTPIALILREDKLIILSHVQLPVMQQFWGKHIHARDVCLTPTPEVFVMKVIDLLVNNVAMILEEAGNELDLLQKRLFESRVSVKKITTRNDYDNIIGTVGLTGNLISKNRESLVSINRFIIYYEQVRALDESNLSFARMKSMSHMISEVHTLNEYASFLSQRNSFIMDATLGLLSVEQNMVIKMFTVAAAVLMPPTLVASVYGMNFKFMPETEWDLGYPLALCLIIVSALIPYLLFKRKGWL